MAKEELIEMRGKVDEMLPDTRYRVTLDNGTSPAGQRRRLDETFREPHERCARAGDEQHPHRRARRRRLADRLRVPVEVGSTLSGLSVGGTGLSPAQLNYVDPIAAVPVGLALGGVS